ncbi:hypothetical protein ABZP36_033881 [Zizania latifolia]
MAGGQAAGMDWPSRRWRAPRRKQVACSRFGRSGVAAGLGRGPDLYAGATRAVAVAVTVTEGDERSGCCQVGRILAAFAPRNRRRGDHGVGWARVSSCGGDAPTPHRV